jgi:hypothetical protein
MTVLIILATAILWDFLLNGGDALANVFRAIGSIFHKPQSRPQAPSTTETEKLKFIQALKEEIDELYEDLFFENTPIEDNLIREQIKYKQNLIDKLFADVENN